MSQSDSDEINRREVAYRLFAAEFEDADYSYAESDEERAPNYVVTPTGARVNRMFVVGVLTEVEQVSDEVVRARVVDPTGAFVIYAGQYQPEALAALESAETPSFVAVTGKARTFQPDDADVIYTSIRPEEVSEVDAETRDRWVVTTAERTVDRVATMAAAHERVERGDNLRDILEAGGVQEGLAAGIPLALDHYDTTPAYLDAVRELALDAARVVAGETTEAGELSLSPSGGGDVPLPFAADLDVDASAVEAAAGGTAEADDATEAEPAGDETTAETADDDAETAAAETAQETPEGKPGDGAETEEAAQPTEAETADEAEAADEGDAEPEPADDEPVDASPAAETPDPGDVADGAAPADDEGGDEAAASGDDDLYELSEDEREEVKENYDVEFSTGTEIPESPEEESPDAEPDANDTALGSGDAGTEADEATVETGEELGDFDAGDEELDTGDEEIETSDEEFDAGDEEFDAGDEEFDESQEDADTSTDFTEDEYDEPESDAADAEGSEPDLDLEDYVVDLMDSLDDGDGALREDVVATAADDLDAEEGEIEDAIQDALMSGRCYESGDDHLKAI